MNQKEIEKETMNRITNLSKGISNEKPHLRLNGGKHGNI